jgi:hypothetical protein
MVLIKHGVSILDWATRGAVILAAATGLAEIVFALLQAMPSADRIRRPDPTSASAAASRRPYGRVRTRRSN